MWLLLLLRLHHKHKQSDLFLFLNQWACFHSCRRSCRWSSHLICLRCCRYYRSYTYWYTPARPQSEVYHLHHRCRWWLLLSQSWWGDCRRHRRCMRRSGSRAPDRLSALGPACRGYRRCNSPPFRCSLRPLSGFLWAPMCRYSLRLSRLWILHFRCMWGGWVYHIYIR